MGDEELLELGSRYEESGVKFSEAFDGSGVIVRFYKIPLMLDLSR